MANDDVSEPISSMGSRAEMNGFHEPIPHLETDPARERFRLRAQCAKLRHWCRDLLEKADGTEGVLPPEIVQELLATLPDMSMDEVFAALYVISQKQPLPISAASLTGDVSALATERQRLSNHYFKLMDAVALEDPPLTEDYFLELAEQPQAAESIGELIGRLEREFEGGR